MAVDGKCCCCYFLPALKLRYASFCSKVDSDEGGFKRSFARVLPGFDQSLRTQAVGNMSDSGVQLATTDGRRLRSERSRKAIMDASLALIEEGCLVPTAQVIAKRAGVGIRSFFRHFPDMGSLFAAIDNEIGELVEALFVGGDRDGILDERILHAVERHADGYEIEQNTILCTAAQSWRYAVLRKNYARYQRGLRKDLEDWLPELRSLDPVRREAVDAIASFEYWHRLRVHHNQSKQAAIDVIVMLLSHLIPNDQVAARSKPR
jgi:AcrR family transcriptional regulator